MGLHTAINHIPRVSSVRGCPLITDLDGKTDRRILEMNLTKMEFLFQKLFLVYLPLLSILWNKNVKKVSKIEIDLGHNWIS